VVAKRQPMDDLDDLETIDTDLANDIRPAAVARPSSSLPVQLPASSAPAVQPAAGPWTEAHTPAAAASSSGADQGGGAQVSRVQSFVSVDGSDKERCVGPAFSLLLRSCSQVRQCMMWKVGARQKFGW